MIMFNGSYMVCEANLFKPHVKGVHVFIREKCVNTVLSVPSAKCDH